MVTNISHNINLYYFIMLASSTHILMEITQQNMAENILIMVPFYSSNFKETTIIDLFWQV